MTERVAATVEALGLMAVGVAIGWLAGWPWALAYTGLVAVVAAQVFTRRADG